MAGHLVEGGGARGGGVGSEGVGSFGVEVGAGEGEAWRGTGGGAAREGSLCIGWAH